MQYEYSLYLYCNQLNTKKMTIAQKDFFVKEYLNTASWTTCDSDENQEFQLKSKKLAKIDADAFIDKVIAEYGTDKGIEILTTQSSEGGYMAAHDFFLTRNHHGAGFWDRDSDLYGSEEINTKLTEISHSFGEVNIYHVKGKSSKLIYG